MWLLLTMAWNVSTINTNDAHMQKFNSDSSKNEDRNPKFNHIGQTNPTL